MGKLDGKIALITGGTSGIGEAACRLFAAEGATVVVVGRNSEAGERIATEIGNGTHFYQCDVSSEENVKELKLKVLNTYNRLDILYNNAGVLLLDRLENIKTGDWKRAFEVNTDSVMYMCREFVDMIVESKGNILNTASIDGLQSNPRGRSTYMYASSKAAVIQFTQIMALNYSDSIRVNCICPGLTETNLFTNRDFDRFNSAIPMGRVAKPEEIARIALFIASDDASYMTGSVITVDGGASLLSANTSKAYS